MKDSCRLINFENAKKPFASVNLDTSNHCFLQGFSILTSLTAKLCIYLGMPVLVRKFSEQGPLSFLFYIRRNLPVFNLDAP